MNMLSTAVCCLVSVVSLYMIGVRTECVTPPPAIANTTHNLTNSPPFPDGTVVRYACDEGYIIDTNTLLTTCSSSDWSTEGIITCSETTCRHVETPDDGYLVTPPTYEIGSFIKFGCDEGYAIAGASQLLCRIDGEWNPRSAPTCTVRDCGEFGDVVNGETFQDNTYVERNKYGSIVDVTCDRGYILSGEPEVKCQSNGQWEPKPSCLQSSCEPYPGLNDRQCVLNYQYTNNLLFIVCEDDVTTSGTRVGPSYARCEGNVWDDTTMACLCDCKIPSSVSNMVEISNLNEKGFVKHGQAVEWSCLDGTYKVGVNDQYVICEHGYFKYRSPNMADIVINTNNRTIEDSDLCFTKQEKHDDFIQKNGANLENSGTYIDIHLPVILAALVVFLSSVLN